MSRRTQLNHAKLAELKLKLAREGFAERIPLDRRLFPRFLRNVRKATGLASIPFWELFGIPTSTGSKYEQLNPDNARICPPELMDEIANALGLAYTETDDPTPLLEKTTGLTPQMREMVAFLYAHNLSMQDLKNYIEIKALIKR